MSQGAVPAISQREEPGNTLHRGMGREYVTRSGKQVRETPGVSHVREGNMMRDHAANPATLDRSGSGSELYGDQYHTASHAHVSETLDSGRTHPRTLDSGTAKTLPRLPPPPPVRSQRLCLAELPDACVALASGSKHTSRGPSCGPEGLRVASRPAMSAVGRSIADRQQPFREHY
ncbi:hypothetical protein FRC12_016336 [Ceratobasidium sp. 428]|nr:hypothetical protein FRC12_016336 [Ceratobasidium sp. 428]